MDIQSLKTILITGANRGIGFGLIKNLIEKNLASSSKNSLTDFPYNIIFTTRSEEKGSETLNSLKLLLNNPPLLNEKLIHIPLDITSESSIENLITQLNQRKLIIDILINNAGVYNKKDPISLKTFDYTFNTNVFGTVNLTERILRESNLLEKNAKIILVASELGNVNMLNSEKLKAAFKKESDENQTLFELADEFKRAIENGTVEKDGWVSDCYHVSKMIENKYAQILANQPRIKADGIQVYSCTPGWVKTDMGGEAAPLSIEEGVVTLIYLIEIAHSINEEMQGKFIRKCNVTDCGL